MCQIDGCEKPIRCKGLCQMHYRRQRHHGTTDLSRTRPTMTEEIFLAQLEDGPDGCWLWTGDADSFGYPRFYESERYAAGLDPLVYAHRWAFEHWNGPIPTPNGNAAQRPTIDHTCHDPLVCKLGRDCPHRRCCNPKHLALVSARDNILRSSGPCAENRRKTHCGSGHEFTPDNTYVTPDGRRKCRACASAAQDRHHNRPIKDDYTTRSPRNADKTHCANGHPYTPANTYVDPKGSRHCRTCGRAAVQQSNRRHRL